MSETDQAQNIPTVAARLRAFMAVRNLSAADMGAAIRTPARTVEKWIDRTKPTKPPACMALLLDLLEQSSQCRRLIGIEKRTSAAARGKPFKRGNPYRFKKAQAPKE
jgi:hypothetical protein